MRLLTRKFDANLPFLAAIALTLFFAPFGALQELMFAGLTFPKIVIPLAFIALIVSRFRSVQFGKAAVLTGLFVLLMSPSIISGTPAFRGIFLLFAGYFALIVMLYSVVNDRKALDLLIRSFVYGLVVVTLMCTLAMVSSIDIGAILGFDLTQDIWGLKRLRGTEENPNAFAVYYIVGLPAAIYCLKMASGWTRRFWVGIIILMTGILLLTVARGAIVGAGAACFILVAYYQKSMIRRLRVLMIIPALVVLVALAPMLLSLTAGHLEVFSGNNAQLLKDKEKSTGNRLEGYGPILEVFMENPVSGVGYGNLARQLEFYNVEQRTAHNIFIGIAVELGAFAVLAFGLIILYVLMIARWLAVTAVSPEQRFQGALLLGSVCGLMINGLVHESYINILLWAVIGLADPMRRCNDQVYASQLLASQIEKIRRTGAVYV